MQLLLNSIGKRFGNEWIFKNINLTINKENNLVILGGNGSGKSTLLGIISGFMQASAGDIKYVYNNQEIFKEYIYKHISIAAPYLELIEEYSAIESIIFQAKFKPFINQLSASEILEISGLNYTKNKAVKDFSSGMKQRLKLTLAILTDAPLLLLDEPCSNLDKKAADWYDSMINQYANNKLIIVCSNHLSHEYSFCRDTLKVEDFNVN